MAIDSNSCERKNGDIHAKCLNEWAESAHEVGQIPALQQRCLKLKSTENRERNQKSVAKNLCAHFPIKPRANIITGKNNAHWGILLLLLQDMRDSMDKNS